MPEKLYNLSKPVLIKDMLDTVAVYVLLVETETETSWSRYIIRSMLGLFNKVLDVLNYQPLLPTRLVCFFNDYFLC